MSNPKGPARPIATRAELDHLKAARFRPDSGLHLSPPGIDGLDVKRRLKDLHENRIKQIETRLKAARTRLRHDLSYSKLKGRARGDFDRSR